MYKLLTIVQSFRSAGGSSEIEWYEQSRIASYAVVSAQRAHIYKVPVIVMTYKNINKLGAFWRNRLTSAELYSLDEMRPDHSDCVCVGCFTARKRPLSYVSYFMSVCTGCRESIGSVFSVKILLARAVFPRDVAGLIVALM
jgi:hypothetical protein